MVDSPRSSPSRPRPPASRQRQERPELLRRPVPQVDVLGRLLGHAQLPAQAARQHPGRAYNETHWPPKDSDLSHYKQALAEPDPTKRHEIVHQMQKLEYNTGGYIIPFFKNLIDAYSSKERVPGEQGTLNLDASVMAPQDLVRLATNCRAGRGARAAPRPTRARRHCWRASPGSSSGASCSASSRCSSSPSSCSARRRRSATRPARSSAEERRPRASALREQLHLDHSALQQYWTGSAASCTATRARRSRPRSRSAR